VYNFVFNDFKKQTQNTLPLTAMVLADDIASAM